MATHASAYQPALDELRTQHATLKARRRALATAMVATPTPTAKRTQELTALNAEMAACAEQIAALQDAQAAAADQDRLEEFERDKVETIKVKEKAIAAATARANLAAAMDSTFGTLFAQLRQWDKLTADVQTLTREVCVRTKPPGGRARPTHERLLHLSNVMRNGGCSAGLAHHIFMSGLGERSGPKIDLVLGGGFNSTPATMAEGAQAGVVALDRAMQEWLRAAGTLSAAKPE